MVREPEDSNRPGAVVGDCRANGRFGTVTGHGGRPPLWPASGGFTVVSSACVVFMAHGRHSLQENVNLHWFIY